MPHVSDGAGWGDLEAAEPDLAARGRALLERSGHGTGLLATVRDDAPPRIHPMSVEVLEGRLLTVALAGSALLDWTHASYYAYYLPPGINERLIKTALWLSLGALISFYTALLHALHHRVDERVACQQKGDKGGDGLRRRAEQPVDIFVVHRSCLTVSWLGGCQ